MGKSKAPKQKIPESTKRAAEIGVQRYNQRIEDGFLDLERDAIADSNINRRPVFARRNAADLATEERMAYDATLLNDPTAVSFGKTGAAVGEAQAKLAAKAAVDARNMQDQQRLNVMNTGLNFGAASDRSLSIMSNNDTSSALSSLRADRMENIGKASAVSSVVNALGTGYISKKKAEMFRDASASNRRGDDLAFQPNAHVSPEVASMVNLPKDF